MVEYTLSIDQSILGLHRMWIMTACSNAICRSR